MREPKQFYSEQLPRQFNAAFEAQHAKASASDAAPADSHLFEAMLGVDTTICVVVEGDDAGPYYLNVESGRMSFGQSAEHPLLLTLVQDRNAFDVLQRESGDSALGFLGGLAGIAGDFQLTGARIAALGQVAGCFRFELKGEGGFSVLTHFGSGELPQEPNASIILESKAYAQLRSGELNPMEAFMNRKIEIDGDMQLAMQLALALVGGD